MYQSISDVPQDIDNIIVLHGKDSPQALAGTESNRPFSSPSFCPCDSKDIESLTEEQFDEIVSMIDPLVGSVALVGALGNVVAHVFSTTRLSASPTGFEQNLSKDLAAYAKTYMDKKFARFLNRNPLRQYNANVFGFSQPSESELRHLVAVGGIRSVLNLRQACELGRIGFGMLAREETLCAELGVAYANVQVSSADWETSVEEVGKVLATLPTPVLVHCQSRGRVDKVLGKLGIA